MESLTDRQQQVLDFINSCLDTQECPPTLREISDHINTKGTASATRPKLEQEELEAESVAYLICKRNGVESKSSLKSIW